ncbi:MAG TPA: transglutaminase-like domain-containing protein [Haliangium sp.]|nr:transglutaminase-like domain-containing protein [Haliangium sp.]
METAGLTLFAHVADRPEEDIELDVASLLIAEWEYEGLDVSRYVALLDEFGELVQQARSGREEQSFGEIRALNRTLFHDLGFRGNQDDYYDPRNSFLHEVIERRTGIPITLSVVYMEVARRAGVRVDGISFPGHFLVRYDQGASAVIIDPFRMGMTLDAADLDALLKRARGPEAELTVEALAPASKREILLRMLTNLAHIYRERSDEVRLVEVLARMHVLDRENQGLERELHRLGQRVSAVN